jgi:hypothetical protein
MARTIKRLRYNWNSLDIDQVIRRGGLSNEELDWWQRAGVDTMSLMIILQSAVASRRRYEGQLQSRLTRGPTQKIRALKKALKDARALIRFFKTEKVLDDDSSPELVFGNLGEQVEHAVQNYIDARLPRPARRGRPGEPWLVETTVLLAFCLMGPYLRDSGRPMAPRQSEKNTIRAIERVLKLAGHGDVVTKEKIRHIIRKRRQAIRRGRLGEVLWTPSPHRSHPM